MLDDLSEILARLERLEAASTPRRGATNQKGAAAYLGVSEETLRRRQARGEGPPRVRQGPRLWSYRFVDLDHYREADTGHTAAGIIDAERRAAAAAAAGFQRHRYPKKPRRPATATGDDAA